MARSAFLIKGRFWVVPVLVLMFLPALVVADGGSITHTDAVHKYLAREAARVWPSEANPGHELWAYLSNGQDTGGYYDGDDIVEGAWEADYPNVAMRWMEHFWDADNRSNPYDYGYVFLGSVNHSAYHAALDWWNAAVAAYPTDRARAYYCLGTVAHYLEDQSVPEHVKLKAHVWANTYEKYIGGQYTRWSATYPQNLIGTQPYATQLPVLPEDETQPLVFRLFYHLNQMTDGEAAYGDYGLFSEKCYAGDYVDRKGTRHNEWKGAAASCPLSRPSAFITQGNRLMPLAIRYVAGLYALFWDATHAPNVLDATLDRTNAYGLRPVAGVYPVDVAIENEGGEPGIVEVTYRVDDGEPVSLVYDADADLYYGDWDTSALAPGSLHTVTLEAMDAFGNTSIVKYEDVLVVE